MAAVAPQLNVRQDLIGVAARGALLLVLLPAGCATLNTFPGALGTSEAVPTGPVYRVVATWNNEVVWTPDPAHGGALIPGLAGRLYLFGPQLDFPLEGDGTVIVDLSSESPDKDGKPQTTMLEQWRLDHDTLARLFRKDMVGWGYTLFLPWSTYKPEIKQVVLKVRYDPAHGTPLFADNGSMTLNSSNPSGRSDPPHITPAAPPAAVVPTAGNAPPSTRLPMSR